MKDMKRAMRAVFTWLMSLLLVVGLVPALPETPNALAQETDGKVVDLGEDGAQTSDGEDDAVGGSAAAAKPEDGMALVGDSDSMSSEGDVPAVGDDEGIEVEPETVVTEMTPHAREIWWLAANGISNGTRVGDVYEFRPYEDVIRRDMAAFLFRLSRLDGRGGAVAGWEPTAAQRSAFADVGPGTIHATSVWWLASTGVSEGWAMPDGTRQFRPASPVARADMAAFLHRLDGLGA